MSSSAPEILFLPGDQVVGRVARKGLEAVCHNAQIVRFPGPHFALELRPRECAEAIGTRIRSIFSTDNEKNT
jgi:hypothetical protein